LTTVNFTEEGVNVARTSPTVAETSALAITEEHQDLAEAVSGQLARLDALAQARTRCACVRESVVLKYHPCSFRTHAR